MRLAVCQAASASGDVAGNARTAADLVAEAAGSGARLAVLPELFLPGYDLAGLAADTSRDLEVDRLDGDGRLDPLRTCCREGRVTALVAASVRRDGDRRLSVLVVDAGGDLSAPYDKQHLWSDEKAVFTAGEHGAVVDVDGWPVGLGVCYDGCFPEHARAAARAGALLYACPAAYVVGSEHRRDLYYRARALDNTMYVAVAGLVGRCGDAEFGGGSAVVDPEGRVLAHAGVEARAVLAVDLDRELLDATRRVHPLLAEAPESDTT